MSRGLKILARELEVPVIGLSQLSRAPEQRPGQGADALRPARVGIDRAGRRHRLLHLPRRVLQRARDPSDPGEADLIIAKHRNGPIGTVPLAFQAQFPRFLNLAGSRRRRRRATARRPHERRASEPRPPRGAALDAARRRAIRSSGRRPRPARRRPAAACARAARSRRGRPARSGSATARGWIVGPEDDGARPATAASGRIEQARVARRSPGRCRSATAASPSTARRSPTWPRDPDARRHGRPRSASSATTSTTGSTRARPLADGGHRHRQDDAGDARLQGRARGRATRVAIYSMPQLLARIRRTYDAEAGEDGYLAFFDRLTSVDLLHLDDLGAENRTDWVLEQLYAIVDRRYEDQRSMVVTTNLDEPRARGADRRADRLAAGRDLRRSAAALRRRSPLPAASPPSDARPPTGRRANPHNLRAMPGLVIVGAQWGDEGKGKVTDLLAEQADLVVRFQGGNNAGHTIVRDGEDVQAAPDPLGDPAPGHDLRDRQRRRHRPEDPDRARSRA